jgi:hypothetical protein
MQLSWLTFEGIQAMTRDTLLRGVRGLTLASLLFISGLAGHMAAGGATPTASVLLRLFLLTVLVVAPFLGAALSPARLAALLIGGQGALHAALQLSAGVAATPTSFHAVTHGDGATHDCAIPLTSAGPIGMALAHVAAGVVVGMWLAVGERALCTLLAFTVRPVVYAWRSLTAIASRFLGAVGMGFPRPQADWLPRYSIRRSLWEATVVSRRGPPGESSPEPYAYAAVSTA